MREATPLVVLTQAVWKRVNLLLSDLLEWIRAKVWELVALFFYSIRVDPVWEEEVKKIASRGVIVHVIRTVHLLDALCLIYFSQRAGLPPIKYVYGLEQWFLRPLRWIYRFMSYQAKGVEERRHLNRVLDEGGSAIICLRRTPKTFKLRGTEMGEQPLSWLIERVRERGESIHLIPHAFVWGRRPESHKHGVFDRIFGPRESPGVLRSLFQVLRSFRSANIHTCEPIDLRAYVEGFAGSSEGGTIEGILQRKLAGEIDRIATMVAGPVTRGRYRTADLIMADHDLASAVREEARRTGKSEEEVRQRCRKLLKEIMPAYHYAFIEAWEHLLLATGVFEKVFDGIHVAPEDLDLIKRLARKGPIILLPGHKSHVDYILLSWIFGHMANLMVPYIAAGKNLSFWPLGWWFRGSGAFFIRRTLGGDKLYSAVLAAFVRRIVQDGHHVEIFMEGTRSRSGKVLPPRLGLFTMVLDAAQRLPQDAEMAFLPVAINYERVIEEMSYSLEQSGRDKSSENIKGLMETQDVLESKYGRIHVRFGRPVALAELRREFPSLTHPESVKKIAYRLFYELDRNFHITPTGLVATVLMCGPDSGMEEEEFFESAAFYLRFGAATGKVVADVLRPCLGEAGRDLGNDTTPASKIFREALFHAIHLLAADDLIKMSTGRGGVYYVPKEARIRLDYYKNTFIGSMAPHALACISLLSFATESVGLDDLRTSARFLSQLLKYEFIFNPNLPFEGNFRAVLSMLESMGYLELFENEGKVRIVCRKEIERVGRLVESLLESYYVTTRAISYLSASGMTEREILRRSFSLHEKLLLEGVVHRPESRNRASMSFCIRGLRDMGVLKQVKSKVYDRGDDYKDREKIEMLSRSIYRFLGGRAAASTGS